MFWTPATKILAALLVVFLSLQPVVALEYHTADTTQDYIINLSELLRVIQFYNSAGLHCQAGSEDNYDPGPGDTSCITHSSDYNPADWDINLSELLRLIQFYNSNGYHIEAGSEDTFGPGPDEGKAMQITFTAIDTVTGEECLWRVDATEGAIPENFSNLIDAQASYSGTDEGPLMVSHDGSWYVFLSERFEEEAAGWAVTMIASADFSSIEAIRTPSGLLHATAGAVSSDGATVIFTDTDGPHSLDIWRVERLESGWGAPVLLTEDSTFDWNDVPALSFDDSLVCFDGSAAPYGANGCAICEVGVDGSGFRVVLGPEDGPEGAAADSSLHSATYEANGGIVFEADWGGGERIWRLPAGSATPTLITDEFGNDNSPVILPDGRIASLWLGHPQGEGGHELKIQNPDGSSWYMLVSAPLTPNIPDIADIGMSAGYFLFSSP